MRRKLATLSLALIVMVSTAFAAADFATKKTANGKVVTTKTATTGMSLRQAKEKGKALNFKGGIKGFKTIADKKQLKNSAAPKSNLLTKSLDKKVLGNKPALAPAADATFYGFMTYSDVAEGYEFDKLTSTGDVEGMWGSEDYIYLGWADSEGNTYCFLQMTFWGYVLSNDFCQFDYETGNTLSEPVDMGTVAASIVTCDITTDKVYVIAVDDDDNYFLGEFDPETPEFKPIRIYDAETELEQIPLHMAAYDGTIYGVNIAGAILKINPADGATTVIGQGNFGEDGPARYFGGMCYIPEVGAFYVNMVHDDAGETSAIYQVNMDGTTSKVFDFENAELYNCMFSLTPEIKEPGTPAKPEVVSNTFEGTPDLSGSFTLSMPSKDATGAEFAAGTELTLTATCGEVAGVCDKASYAPGEAAVVTFSDLEEGMAAFTFTVANGDLSNKVNVSLYIGNDTPKAPANVVLNENGVEWDAVLEGVHAGYLDLAALTYDVYVDDEKVASDVVGTSCEYEIPEGPMASHVAEVYAKCNGLTSAAGISGKFVYGDPYELPVTLAPTEDEVDQFTIIDANGDGRTWTFNPNTGWFRNAYNSSEDADDWLILPAINFDSAEAIYEFAMDVCNYSNYYPERFEVKMGTAATAAAMTIEVIAPTDIPADNTESDPLKAQAFFVVPAAGTYYIGIHGISDADNFYLECKNFNVTKSDKDGSIPAKPTNIVATAGAQGALNCSVSFNMPTATFTGTPLDAALDLTATVSSTEGSKQVTGKPGAAVSVEGLPTVQGENTISIVINDGEKDGIAATTVVYTGFDRPLAPTNFKMVASEDNMSATLTWSAPGEVGVNGGYVAPTGITYYLCTFEESLFGLQPVISAEIGEDVFTYTYTLPAGTEQDVVYLGVIAENAAGQGKTLSYGYDVLGTPLDMPVKDNFSELQGFDTPLMFMTDGWYGGPLTQYDKSMPDDWCIWASSETNLGDNTIVQLPKFSTLGADKPVFMLDALFGAEACNYVIYAQAYGVDRVKIAEFSDAEAENFLTKKVELPAEFKNKSWVYLTLVCDFETGEVGALRGYQIKNDVANDLAVTALAGPKSVKVGASGTYTATIENYGSETAATPTVRFELKKGDKVVASDEQAQDGLLEEGQKVQYTWSYEFTADEIGECTVTATILGEDAVATNNSRSLDVKVSADKSKAGVTDLAASADGDEVTLTWSAPVIATTDGTFESGDANEFTPADICGFQNIDGDGLGVYGFNGWDCPNAFQPAGWTVWDDEVIASLLADAGYDDTNTFAAHGGHKYIIAFSPDEDANGDGYMDPADDWLISPEIKGGTILSFYARAVTDQYGDETIEVLYSTTGTNPEDFKVGTTFNFSNEEWKEMAYTLPRNAKYFAIRYCSEDIFGVMIDDIDFTPAGGGADITGYDIYRNGELIAENAAADCTYVDTLDESGEYSYNVVPVLADGSRGLKSNTAVVEVSSVNGLTVKTTIIAGKGTITLNGFAGQDIRIAAADGKVVAVRNNAENNEVVNVPAGIYMVSTGKKVTKVIVK